MGVARGQIRALAGWQPAIRQTRRSALLFRQSALVGYDLVAEL